MGCPHHLREARVEPRRALEGHLPPRGEQQAVEALAVDHGVTGHLEVRYPLGHAARRHLRDERVIEERVHARSLGERRGRPRRANGRVGDEHHTRSLIHGAPRRDEPGEPRASDDSRGQISIEPYGLRIIRKSPCPCRTSLVVPRGCVVGGKGTRARRERARASGSRHPGPRRLPGEGPRAILTRNKVWIFARLTHDRHVGGRGHRRAEHALPVGSSSHPWQSNIPFTWARRPLMRCKIKVWSEASRVLDVPRRAFMQPSGSISLIDAPPCPAEWKSR